VSSGYLVRRSHGRRGQVDATRVVGGMIIARNLFTNGQFGGGSAIQFTIPWAEGSSSSVSPSWSRCS
jgi:hypothetical protein